MAKYHINTKGEPGVCRAKHSCPFGDLTADHYGSREEALVAYEAKMTQFTPPVHTRSVKSGSLNEELFRSGMDQFSYDDLSDFANESPAAHAIVDRAIDARAEETVAWGKKLDEVNPALHDPAPVDKETFKKLRKEYLEYRDQTAQLVDVYQNSRFYRPPFKELPPEFHLGTAVAKTGYSSDTAEWLRERFNSVGGSDVGCLVKNDFTPAEELQYFDHAGLRRVEESKLALPTDEQIAMQQRLAGSSHGGAPYRGTVWEGRIRERFARDHPDHTVYVTKNQYSRAGRSWQQVNFDGVVSDRPDGQPNGILEFKTGDYPSSWDGGVPLNHRAQVLYYLNSTGYDYAMVGACLRDGEYRYFRLDRDAPVAPGSYDKPMESYIQERVTPWFQALQARRS